MNLLLILEHMGLGTGYTIEKTHKDDKKGRARLYLYLTRIFPLTDKTSTKSRQQKAGNSKHIDRKVATLQIKPIEKQII